MKRVYLALAILICWLSTKGQDTLSLEEQWALLEAELDSISIFNAIDSLLSAEQNLPSEFNFHLSYNSNISSAGRNYGIDQHGLSPGVSFYHKSGLWGDLSGYWNSETDPKYNLSVASVGFINFVKPKWSYGISYERWISNGGSTIFTNSLGIASGYNFGPISTNLDYSFLFGEETANRIIGTVSGNLNLKAWWIFKKISINPMASAIVGNDNVTSFSVSTNERLNNLFLLTQLSSEELDQVLLLAVLNDRLTRDEAMQIRRRINNLTDEQYERLLDAVFIEENDKVFGVLNYNFSLPISLATKKLIVLIAYTYSIPIKLPGEETTFDPIGYFSLSFNYRLSRN